LEELLKSMRKPTGIPAAVALGATPRQVWINLNVRVADRLADALREDARERHSPAAAASAARSIVAVFAVTLEQGAGAALAGRSAQTVRRELAATIESVAAAGTLGRQSRTRRWCSTTWNLQRRSQKS